MSLGALRGVSPAEGEAEKPQALERGGDFPQYYSSVILKEKLKNIMVGYSMRDYMKYEKKHINRAIIELTECINNILNAERDQYALRIKQLFLTIKNNEILNFIITPYLDLQLDEKNVGFISTGHQIQCNFVIPEDEDEEIALILEVLKYMAEDESTIESGPFSIYMKNSYDENLYLFNRKIVEPAFNKLLRKLQYKIEDIGDIQDDKIEAGEITIINIGKITADKSMIAIGKNITQQSENVFEEIRNEITKNIEDECIKNELLSYLAEMEKNKADKKTFKDYYDRFINKLGVYMSIIGPLLPYLVDYFK
ncbi:MAG: hypothetical protein LBK66_04625 [Spirochaetaceae bacterium]|nr:hypothetical protein [Spirochaetaceae bacterium]